MGATMDVSARVARFAIMVALLGIVGSSVFSLTGWEQGWARLCKEDLQTESSPYAGMMQYLLIRYPDKDGLTPDFVAAIEFQLPDPKTTTFRIKLKLGLMRLKNSVWITRSDPVAQHIQIVAKQLAPKRFHDNVGEIFGEHRSSMVEEYDGDRTGAKVLGAITAASIMMSALLAIVLLFGCIASCWGSVPKPAQKIAEWSLLIGIITLCVVCIEFVALAIGTHRDSKSNPLLMKGYIPVPDYAWYSAVLSSIFWMCVWGALRRDPDVLDLVVNERSKSGLPAVGWGVPVEMSKLAKEEGVKQYP